MYLIGYLKTLYEPFLPSTPSEPLSAKPIDSTSSVEQYEMKLKGSVVDARVAVSGSEANHALIAQVSVNIDVNNGIHAV